MIDTPVTQPGSRPVRRYRLISPEGKRYAPFRVKPGFLLMQIVPKDDDWDIEAAESCAKKS